jgi:hypothetical protein
MAKRLRAIRVACAVVHLLRRRVFKSSYTKKEIMIEETEDWKYKMKCAVTGNVFNDGYVIGDGDYCIEERSDFIAHLRKLDWMNADGIRIQVLDLSDEDLMQYFFNEEYYIYTEFSQENISDYDDYYLEDGTLIQIN